MSQKESIEVDERLKRVYDWSSRLTAENRDVSDVESDYVWPTSIATLRERLKIVHGAVIAVVGLQGVGKTRAFKELVIDLPTCIAFKWPSDADWRRTIGEQIAEEISESYDYALMLELRRTMKSGGDKIILRIQNEAGVELAAQARYLASASTEKQVIALIDAYNLDAQLFDVAERLIPKMRLRELRNRSVESVLQKTGSVLIDMPDYSRKDMRLMTRDLTEIQNVWKTMKSEPNLVIFFQRELFKGQSHFFLGKMDVVNLEPFTAAQMLEAYKRKFETSYPFDESALLEVARMSRGIFRRFLKYIRVCIDQIGAIPLNSDFVRDAISLEQIAADMELELSEFFPRAELRAQAVRVLEYVRSAPPNLNQIELAGAVEIDDMTLSRILTKLETYRYVQLHRGEKGEKRIALGNFCTCASLSRLVRLSRRERSRFSGSQHYKRNLFKRSLRSKQ